MLIFYTIKPRPPKTETNVFFLMTRCEDYYSLSKNRTLFIQKFLHLLPELAALAFEKLVISDDFYSMFGKYFRSKRSHTKNGKFLRLLFSPRCCLLFVQ